MANQNQGQNQGSGRTGTQNRGFASMSDAEQREIARMGGAAVSENREHMAQIGRKGGEASAEARASLRNQALNASAMAEGGSTKTPSQASGRKGGDAATPGSLRDSGSASSSGRNSGSRDARNRDDGSIEGDR